MAGRGLSGGWRSNHISQLSALESASGKSEMLSISLLSPVPSFPLPSPPSPSSPVLAPLSIPPGHRTSDLVRALSQPFLPFPSVRLARIHSSSLLPPPPPSLPTLSMPVSLASGVQTGTQKEVFFTFSRFVFRSVWMALDSCWEIKE